MRQRSPSGDIAKDARADAKAGALAPARVNVRAFIDAIELLFRPFQYFRIRHAAKTVFDFWLPAMCAVGVAVLYLALPVRPAILTDSGLLKDLRDVISIMVAFYVAALIAIVSIESPFLEARMAGRPGPQILHSYLGASKWIVVSRRYFLGHLIGYLVCLQLAIIVVSFAIKFIAPWVASALSDGWLLAAKAVAVFVCAFAFAQIAIGTLIVVHYLGARLNGPGAKALTPDGEIPAPPLPSSERDESDRTNV